MPADQSSLRRNSLLMLSVGGVLMESVKASPELMAFAKLMLAILVGLSIWSVFGMVRSFYRPLDASPQKLAASRKALFFSSWVMLGAVGSAVNALASKQYYLLGASAILFSFVLPVFVQYVRLKRTLRRHQMQSYPNAKISIALTNAQPSRPVGVLPVIRTF